jgi:Tol biopolymer transport system component
MPLQPGARLGPYEILSPLGAGGMGEVYCARDTRLSRTVAIKILPTHLSQDTQARERFDREARAISSLSHPNICHLYDVGQQNGISYLVMEYLEGETLADRLRKGPLSLDQVLKVGIEISEGLERAHRGGVVHRDLKPSNIMLTKSGAKLMDFGLAKAEAVAVGAGASPDSLATMSQPLTAEGTIVGTFQYMSPEQVEGKAADSRSDIFSLGTVLYEMVTGKRAFEGKTTASTIAAILAGEPQPISAIQPMSPPALEHVTNACLAKDPEERLQSAHDVKVELQWIARAGSHAGAPIDALAGRVRRDRLPWLLVGLLLLVVIGGGAARLILTRQTLPAMYFNSPVPVTPNDLALSPDARTVAVVAYSDQANKYVIWTYEVGGRGMAVVPGTENASHPFWSPDSKSIGFFADGKLKKVEVPGGQVQVLCEAPNGRGGTWNRDGVIVFTPDSLGGLSRVPSSGGSPVELTKPDASRLETTHRWPVFLPDGKHFLYLGANFSGHLENNAIFLGSLDSQERRWLVNTSANAAYAEPGYLLYLRENKTLVAQPFDRRRYVLSGEPQALGDEVRYFPLVDRALFSVSSGSVLVTQPGKGTSPSQLTWFDRTGKSAGTVGVVGSYGNVRLSPDGRRIATDQTDAAGRNGDIWILDPTRGTTARLTFGPSYVSTPIWSPDGRQILFGSNRELGFQVYLKNADGSGSEEPVGTWGSYTQVNPWDWSRDAKHVLVRKANELWYLSWPERVAKPLLQRKGTVRNAQFSPDGRWMAFASTETGSMEIYVSPFPSANGKWQVSSGGGEEPRWRQDGKELFYLSADGKMMAVAVTAGVSFEAGSPVALFQTRRRQEIGSQDVFSYDVSGDGQRFLILTRADAASAAPIAIHLNWASELEK